MNGYFGDKRKQRLTILGSTGSIGTNTLDGAAAPRSI